jgi:hypothetical protein
VFEESIMRAILLLLSVGLVLAAPVGSQTCKKAPPPFLPGLFPKEVEGYPLEFSSVPGGGCMGMYRPPTEARQESAPWVILRIEVEPDEALGESAPALLRGYKDMATPIITVDDWPVTVTTRSIGDEFVAVKGSLRITVLVKNGDHGKASQDLATPFLHLLLSEVPCG